VPPPECFSRVLASKDAGEPVIEARFRMTEKVGSSIHDDFPTGLKQSDGLVGAWRKSWLKGRRSGKRLSRNFPSCMRRVAQITRSTSLWNPTLQQARVECSLGPLALSGRHEERIVANKPHSGFVSQRSAYSAMYVRRRTTGGNSRRSSGNPSFKPDAPPLGILWMALL
jgi:hypothetical protein